MKVVILDLETVPDYNVWTRPEAPIVDTTKCERCLEPLPVPPPAKAPKCKTMTRGTCRPPKAPPPLKDVFPPRYAHRVVCAGLLAMTGDDGYTLGYASAPTADDEPGLLGWLAQTLENFDRIITWGGTRFDLPVLEMRSLHHGISQPAAAYVWTDLHDVLAPRWQVDDKINLDTITRLIGLPGKNGVDGSMVEAMADSGNFDAIGSYCLHDVVQTGYLYLRTELLHHRLNREQYREECVRLRTTWEAREDFKGFKVSPRVELT